MSITGIDGVGPGYRPGTSVGKGATDGASFDTMLEAFMKEASKTPEQRAREKVLEKHDLTEESYAKLAPEQREAIDREITDAVRRVHERKTGVPAQPAYFVPTAKLFG